MIICLVYSLYLFIPYIFLYHISCIYINIFLYIHHQDKSYRFLIGLGLHNFKEWSNPFPLESYTIFGLLLLAAPFPQVSNPLGIGVTKPNPPNLFPKLSSFSQCIIHIRHRQKMFTPHISNPNRRPNLNDLKVGYQW